MILRPLLLACLCLATLALRAADAPPPGAFPPAVTPLPAHPGNVFLAGERVAVRVPGDPAGRYEIVDEEGRTVRPATAADGAVTLDGLPVGYYEVRPEKPGAAAAVPTAFAVLAPLAARPSAGSPLALDTAMSWFYKTPEQKAAVASLCALAGIGRVRDRLNWGEVQPERTRWLPDSRYDQTVEAFSAAGLRVLQVNHNTAGWAGKDHKRFPADLRDAYRFYRDGAARWKGKVDAWEPWNEADIAMFGGHTGAEIAAMQKACYLGIKDGDPGATVGQNVFATARAATLADFAANEPWPYADTMNLHHYIPVRQYGAWYAAFRQVSGGRPLWVTECSLPVKWAGDARAQEPTPADLRTQAHRVPIVFAAALQEGAAAVFYFILGHYVEGQTQFGIIRRDLTPRPAYVALAAVGRLLAEARALGRLDVPPPPGAAPADRPSPSSSPAPAPAAGDPSAYAIWFAARPDGADREVLVAWCDGAGRDLALPAAPERVFDALGRPLPTPDPARRSVRIGPAPVYAILPAGSTKGLALRLAPASRPVAAPAVKPSRIVLQPLAPAEQTSLARSAYLVRAQTRSLPLAVYNFGTVPARGALQLDAPDGWTLSPGGPIELPPGERKELSVQIQPSDDWPTAGRRLLTLRGDFGPAGRPVLSLRLRPDPLRVPAGATVPLPDLAAPGRWQAKATGGSKVALTPAAGGGVTVDVTLGPGDRWIYPQADLAPAERPAPGARALAFTLVPHDGVAKQTHWRVLFNDGRGPFHVGDVLVQPTKPGVPVEAIVLLDDLSPPLASAPRADADPARPPDYSAVRTIAIGCNAKADRVRYEFRDLHWVKGDDVP